MDAGFHGGFVSFPKDIGAMPKPIAGWMPPPTIRQTTSPWPNYIHTPTHSLLYPPQLRVNSAVPFTLTLPGPTVAPLYRYLATSTQSREDFLRQFISLLFLWTRSLQMIEFTPECLTLMVIRFMQVRCIFSSRLTYL
jgi:hypothetical protein